MSIQRRIALVSAAAVAVTVFVVSIGAFLGAKSQIMGPIDESLLQRASRVEIGSVVFNEGPVFGSGGRGGNPFRELVTVFARPGSPEFDTAFFQIITPEGTLNIGSDELELPPPDPNDVDPDETMLRSVWVDGTHLRIATLVVPGTDSVVQIGRPLTEADDSLAGFAILLAVGSLLGILLAGGLGMVVARQAVRPIGDLERSVSEITHTRDIGGRLDVSGSDEIAALAIAFNALLAEVEATREEQTRLVRDAGHELRTPLTALRTNIEILQRHEVEADVRKRMLGAAHAEVEELTELVSEVVDLATDRYEEEPLATVELRSVVEAIAERLERRNGRSVVLDADTSAVVGKRAALERAIGNIVANADKWSPVDGDVTVTIREGTLTVVDSGPGIADSDIGHVFERFYRSDAARSAPGSGLGLSIVEQIVTDHDGHVFARNRSTGTGAEVGFTIPPSDGASETMELSATS
jgi:two-component system sensor histidine kinase MprB